MRKTTPVLPLLALAAILLPQIAAASATFTISGNLNFFRTIDGKGTTNPYDSFNTSSPLFLSNGILTDFTVSNDETFHGFNFVAAGTDGLHAAANTSVHQTFTSSPNLASGGLTTNAAAEVTYTDFVISGPAGSVTTSYNLHVSGLVSASSLAAPGSAASAFANLTLQINGNNVGAGSYSINSATGISTFGLFQGYAGSANVISDSFTVPANTPFRLYEVLSVNSTSAINESMGGGSQSNVDFGSTVSFATDRPVFNLPAGYTVQSIDAGITNNQFTAPAPEPSTLVLLSLTLALPLSRRRRKAEPAA